MHAVAQQQAGGGGNAFQKEPIKWQVMFFSQVRIDRIERLLVVGAHIGRCQHADKCDRDTALFQACYHGFQIGLRQIRRNTAQRVICPEFQHNEICRVRN